MSLLSWIIITVIVGVIDYHRVSLWLSFILIVYHCDLSFILIVYHWSSSSSPFLSLWLSSVLLFCYRDHNQYHYRSKLLSFSLLVLYGCFFLFFHRNSMNGEHPNNDFMNDLPPAIEFQIPQTHPFLCLVFWLEGPRRSMCPMVETPGMFRQNWLKETEDEKQATMHYSVYLGTTTQVPGCNPHKHYETFLSSRILYT